MTKLVTLFQLVAAAALAFADSVPEGIAPDSPTPSGCQQTVDGNFTLATIQVDLKRDTSDSSGTLVCNLKKGVLHDNLGRTGGIVSNYQFQFDGPPQAGTIYTGGWAVCQNNSLALGDSTIFWRCGSGAFVNIYDRYIGAQCEPANIEVTFLNKPSSSSSVASSTSAASSSASSAFATLSSVSASSVSQTVSVADPRQTSNSTVSTGGLSASGASATKATASGTGAARSTGGALPTRVPQAETFGAAFVGILGAALIL